MESESLLCPYKVEQYIAHFDSIAPYFANALSDHVGKMTPDEKIRATINVIALCDKDHCAAWNGYCARIFKGGDE